MILLVWNQFGEAELQLYEFLEDTDEGKLAAACHNHFVNSSVNDRNTEDDLDSLSNILLHEKPIVLGPSNFGPYSAIYVSGFIP